MSRTCPQCQGAATPCHRCGSQCLQTPHHDAKTEPCLPPGPAKGQVRLVKCPVCATVYATGRDLVSENGCLQCGGQLKEASVE